MTTTIGSLDLASLKNLRDDVTQYFWFESDSSSAWGSGAHVTLYPESQFTDSTNPNYMKGQNIIMNTDGFSIRNGGLPMMVLDNDSLDFNVVDTTQGTYVTMATFGLTGATIGQTSGSHIQISSSGLDVNLNSSTNIANFGTNGARIGQTEQAHFEVTDSHMIFIGNDGNTYVDIGDSMGGTLIESFRGDGTNTDFLLSYYASSVNFVEVDLVYVHDYTIVDDDYGTHVIFDSAPPAPTDPYTLYNIMIEYEIDQQRNKAYTLGTRYRGTSIGMQSYVLGTNCTASGKNSFAVGYHTNANTDFSYAQGLGSITYRPCQMAIGKYGDPYNRNDAFLIGNGTSDLVRSNAFTVDWDGNVEAAGALFANGAEFSKKASNHIVIGGYHVCWGDVSVSCTANTYTQTTVTLPYTYTNAPHVFTSFASQNANARTTYGTNGGDLPLNQIHVGALSLTTRGQTVCWMTIGV